LKKVVSIVVYVEFHDGSTSKLHDHHASSNMYKSYSYSETTLGESVVV
jgi:hypothetical protein